MTCAVAFVTASAGVPCVSLAWAQSLPILGGLNL